MTDKEFVSFLMENKRKFDEAMRNFDKHSALFDKKINKIFNK